MSSTDALSARHGARYRWLATATALVASISVILSATIVNVAIPDVMGAFGIDQTKAQWLSTGFLAAMAATMPLTDWADRALGQRRAVSLALLLFTVGSLLGGLAPDENTLIVARILQGAAAGIIQPLSMVIIYKVSPPESRGSAMGIFGVGVVLAPALGPWIGGLLMDAFDWRWVFYLGVPFAALGIVLANLFLPSRVESGRWPGFDWIGFGLLCVFLGTLLAVLSGGQRFGWDSDLVLGEFAAAALAFTGFVWWESRATKPMLDLRLFTHPPFAAASIVSFVMGMGLFGSIYLLPVFVQTIQGLSPTEAGLLLMPAGFVLAIVFPIAGRLSDLLPPAILIGVGLILFAYSSILTSQIDVHTGFWQLAWWTLLTRVAVGVVFPALSVVALQVLPAALVTQGSGAINFTRQLGGAFGVNVLTVLLERRTSFHADAFAATQTPDNGSTMVLLEQVARLARVATLPEIEQRFAAEWFLREAVHLQASTLAYRDGFLVTAAVFVAALAPTLLLRSSRPVGAQARKGLGRGAGLQPGDGALVR